jgi:hypothetical protein
VAKKRQFGLLRVAIDPNPEDLSWVCKCECGKLVRAPVRLLLSGKVTSCGCELEFLRSEVIRLQLELDRLRHDKSIVAQVIEKIRGALHGTFRSKRRIAS